MINHLQIRQSKRHWALAHGYRFHTATREPLPLVRFVRSRTVAKVDSIGLVVRG